MNDYYNFIKLLLDIDVYLQKQLSNYSNINSKRYKNISIYYLYDKFAVLTHKK